MASQGKKRTAVRRRAAKGTEGQVFDYLQANPDFFNRHPELFKKLNPPGVDRGEGVVDFQQHMVRRLQGYVRELDDYQNRLVEATRSNFSNQQRIHNAVLMLLDPQSLEETLHVICHEWVDLLGVDAITVNLECTQALARQERDIRRLTRGYVKKVMGDEHAVILRGSVEADRRIFGPAAPLVRAEALVRLYPHSGQPGGILAFGTRNGDSFYPGQGTELLRFVGRVVERNLGNWIQKAS